MARGRGAQGVPDAAGVPDGRGGLSRRSVLLGAAAVAGGAAAASLLGEGSGAGATPWPDRRLTAADARRVDASQFLSSAQLRTWSEALDAMGMRATGDRVHDRFIDTLLGRLARVGVHDVHAEPVPITRWTVGTWSLRAGGTAVDVASYIPYSGSTPPDGVRAPLVPVDPAAPPAAGSLAGRIALFDVPASSVPYSTMALIAYGTVDPRHLIDPAARYARPWGGVADLITFLDRLPATGAVGCIGVLDLPAAGAHGSYYPYDGVVRRVPGLFVDAGAGARLRAVAAAGGSVDLTVTATTERVVTRNVVGTIPGATDEVVVLNSHTDGPNAVEDNGPDVIVAMCQYLARLPRQALPRTVVVSLTTGHFHGGIGQIAFIDEHRHTTLARTACAVTLEHLGALEWDEDAAGEMALTGRPELGVVFVPGNRAMVAAAQQALVQAGAGPAMVLRPYVEAPGSPDGHGWPGEGTQLWTDGHVMTMNYITGPTYLLNWGIPTVDKTDFARMRREAIAFTDMVLGLCRVPRGALGTLDLPGI